MDDPDFAKKVSAALHWVVEHRKLGPCKHLRKQREEFFRELELLEKDRSDLADDAQALRHHVEEHELTLATAHAQLLDGKSDEARFLENVETCANAIATVRAEIDSTRLKPRR